MICKSVCKNIVYIFIILKAYDNFLFSKTVLNKFYRL